MSWSSALKKSLMGEATSDFTRPTFPLAVVDWSRIVTIDFETYWDTEYTLKKLSTSEYVRDPRFKVQMMGIKVGNKPTRIVPGTRVKSELAKINWGTHTLLCHNAAFDGFILSHHYGVVPSKYYDTLSMARGLHSNEIGAGLDEVAKFYGGQGKVNGVLEKTLGVRAWPKALFDQVAVYCTQDNEECYRIFTAMHSRFPADEMDLVDIIIRMFCDPVLKVDIPRVEAELKRELERREKLMFSVVDPTSWHDAKLLKGKEKLLPEHEANILAIKRVIGSNEKFADLLRAEGVDPPTKISPAWVKKPAALRNDDDKYAYAFAKDDLKFINLPNDTEAWGAHFDPDNLDDIKAMAARQLRIQALIETRIAVKSTTNVTRAQRFLTAGANGMSLPAGYAYYRAHTGRLGGNNRMNMQNLTRGGELRLSILAPKGHMLAVADSGQIEVRVNAWLWGQHDLLDDFRANDAGLDRDPYCKFGDVVYGRVITKANTTERFVAKTATLGLGYQMGAPKFQMTLAKGAGGPAVFMSLAESARLVELYRAKNDRIRKGWSICARIIEDMAAGRTGAHGPVNWEANTVWLPNGMALKYPDLKKRMNDEGRPEWTYQSGDMRKKIYGGLLDENLVQALARIIVMWQTLQISRKHRVVMSTHDEAVVCVKAAHAKAAFAYMEKYMKTPPPWCSDIPLNCEGGFAANYSK